MKILQIIPSLGSGGAERFTVDLCNELSKRNEVILVVLFPLDTPNLSFYKNDVFKNVKIVSLNKRKGADFSILFKIYDCVRKYRPNVVHTHLAAIVYAQLAIRLLKAPIYVHTVHNEAAKEAGGGYLTVKIRRNSFIRKRVLPVTISDESKRSFSEFYGMEANMIFNGRNIFIDSRTLEDTVAELNGYRVTDNTKILINLARIESQKRQDLMVRAAKKLGEEGFDFKIIHIGSVHDTEMFDRIKKNCCSNFITLGERHNPLDYLSVADGFTLSSNHEGMPISLIEALGTGCVPVCTPVGGIVDVIDNGINGILSDDISEVSYYNALKQFLLLDKNQLKNMKKAALKSYMPFSMVECSNKYELLYKKQTTERIFEKNADKR